MKTLIKAVLGAAILAGSAIAASAPAQAQPGYGPDFERGYSGRSYDDFGYGYRNRNPSRYCLSARVGRWRFDPYLQRRVFVPYRWARFNPRMRDCVYVWNRYDSIPGPWR